MSDTATADAMTNTGTGFGSFGYRTYVLLTLTVVYTFNFIDRILISVVGRPIIDEFGLSNLSFRDIVRDRICFLLHPDRYPNRDVFLSAITGFGSLVSAPSSGRSQRYCAALQLAS